MTAPFHSFQSLVENNLDAISVIDGDNKIIYSSAANQTMFGYAPGELLEQDWLGMVHPEDCDSCIQLLRDTLAEPSGNRHGDLRIRHKNGNYCWVEMRAAGLPPDLNVQAIGIYLRDIQARRAAAEQHQLQTEAALGSNARMEEFAYTVAHDLREPLRAMSVYSQFLLQTVLVDSEAEQMAKYILRDLPECPIW